MQRENEIQCAARNGCFFSKIAVACAALLWGAPKPPRFLILRQWRKRMRRGESSAGGTGDTTAPRKIRIGAKARGSRVVLQHWWGSCASFIWFIQLVTMMTKMDVMTFFDACSNYLALAIPELKRTCLYLYIKRFLNVLSAVAAEKEWTRSIFVESFPCWHHPSEGTIVKEIRLIGWRMLIRTIILSQS